MKLFAKKEVTLQDILGSFLQTRDQLSEYITNRSKKVIENNKEITNLNKENAKLQDEKQSAQAVLNNINDFLAQKK